MLGPGTHRVVTQLVDVAASSLSVQYGHMAHHEYVLHFFFFSFFFLVYGPERTPTNRNLDKVRVLCEFYAVRGCTPKKFRANTCKPRVPFP